MKEDTTEDRFIESLSERELEILSKLQRGASDRQIAQELHLSVNTIKWYNRQIYSKLGVSGRKEAVRFAEKHALLTDKGHETKVHKKGPRHNLPALDLADFIGRESELKNVRSWLGSNRLVTVTGPGGVGKTRLALQVAAESLEDFIDGVYLVEMASLAMPEMIMNQVAKALAIREQPGKDLNERLIEFLSERRILLVLDNFEQLLAGAERLGELLARAPQFTILATSRERLGLHIEQVFPLAPLEAVSAVDLFYQRARSIEPDFDPERQQESAVRHICQLVDQLPLGVELAAGRIPLLPPSAIEERLLESIDPLISGDRDRPDRHQTLMATIDWSYQLLSGPEKQLFAAIGGFATDTYLDGVLAVCDPKLSATRLEVNIQALISKSLILSKPGVAVEPKIGMLSSIRHYAREKIADEGLFHQRMAGFYLSLTEKMKALPRQPRQLGGHTFQRIEQELPNIWLAVKTQLEAGEIEVALNLFINLRYYFWAMDPSQGLQWANGVLEYSSDAPERPYAQALTVAAEMHNAIGDYLRAWELVKRALSMLEKHEADYAKAEALRTLGDVQSQMGNLDEAESNLREALELFGELGSGHDVSVIHNSLGELMRLRADYGQAKEYYEESLRIRSEGSFDPSSAAILLNLAAIARHSHQANEALKYSLDALIASKARQILPMICGALEMLSGLLMDQDPVRSAGWIAAAAATRKEIGFSVELVDRPMYEQDVDNLRQYLGEKEFKQVYEEGRKVELDQIASQAIEAASNSLRSISKE